MGLEVLRSRVQKMTTGQTTVQKERTTKELFARWSHGGIHLSLPQFRMALSELGLPPRAAEDIFNELDHNRRGNIEVQQVIRALVPPAPISESPHTGIRPRGMQESRSSSAAELRGSQDKTMGFVPEAISQRKIREFWDLIGSRAYEKGYKSVNQLLRALDKDDDGQLNRMEARKFFKVNLCLAVSKADEFFNLLDTDKDGKVSCKEIGKHVAPYLQHGFRPPTAEEVGDWQDSSAAFKADQAREQELRKYWDLIGHRAADRGFKSAVQLLLAMDKDDSGTLDRKELRAFLCNYVCFSQANADRLFDLLDDGRRGKVSAKEFRRCLEPYFHKSFHEPSAPLPNFRSENQPSKAELQEEREKDIRRFWDVIGHKFHERGFRSCGQVLMGMDTDDSGSLDRNKVRTFFDRHLGFPASKADQFFDLLDPNGSGAVSSRAVAQHLAPYFQSTHCEPGEIVGGWEESDREAVEQPAAGKRTQPGTTESQPRRQSGTATPGRPGMGRQPSMPSWTPQSARSTRSAGGLGSATPGPPGGGRGGARPSSAANGAAAGGGAPQALDGHLPGSGPGGRALDLSACSFATDHPIDYTASMVGPDSGSGELPHGSQRVPAGDEASARGSAALGGGPSRPSRPPQGRQAAGPSRAVDLSAVVVGEFRRAILARGGTHGIHALDQTFRIGGSDRDLTVSPAELDATLRQIGVQLEPKDLSLLLRAIDKDGNDCVAYGDFLRALRGPLSTRRLQIVDMAFDVLDRNGAGRLALKDFQAAYDINHHPEVAAGKMPKDEALGHFLSQFDGMHHYGYVTKKEFHEYYANISASMEDDTDFELMMQNAWRGGQPFPIVLTGPAPVNTCYMRDEFVAPRPRRHALRLGDSDLQN